MLKKTNKKGFTLIELIIVIAIMAILIALLAPQLIKYIEKSKVSKDMNTLDAVYQAIATEMADEDLSKYSTGTTGTKIAGKALKDLDEGEDDDKALYAALFDASNPVLNAKFVSDDVFTSNACDGAVIYIFVRENGGVAVAAVNSTGICAYEGDDIFASGTMTIADIDDTVKYTTTTTPTTPTTPGTGDEGTN